jgi:hypothetical protein
MKKFYKLVIPEKVEIILFLSIALGLLLLQNIKRFWLLLQGDAVVVVENVKSIDNAASSSLTSAMNKISPRLVDFLLWALIGCVVFVIISIVIAFIKSMDSEAEFLHYYQSPSGRIHEINSFLTKLGVRLIGFIGLFIWFLYFVNVVNTTLCGWFFTAIGSLGEPSSWLWLFLSIVLMAACLFLFVIFARLIALKPRITGTASE